MIYEFVVAGSLGPITRSMLDDLEIVDLGVETWLRFIVWMVIGFVIYFMYGASHSRVGMRAASGEGEATAALDAARASSPLVLISAAVAAGIDAAALRAAMMALQPLVLIVPDAQGEVTLPDLAARLRGQLGMEA